MEFEERALTVIVILCVVKDSIQIDRASCSSQEMLRVSTFSCMIMFHRNFEKL